MDPSTIWIVCAILSIPAGMMSLLNFFSKRNYVLGAGWMEGKKPDPYDWFLALVMSAVIVVPMWPVLVAYGTAITVRPSTRKELKRENKARKQQLAFDKMKEAHKCKAQVKRELFLADTKQWDAEYYEADTKDRARRHAEHQRRVLARVEERNRERIERERMYSDARGSGDYGHSGLVYCKHGNSIGYPCSYC